MSPHNIEKRALAVEYLKFRGIHVLNGRFHPTSSAATDVSVTWARYRTTVMLVNKSMIRAAK